VGRAGGVQRAEDRAPRPAIRTTSPLTVDTVLMLLLALPQLLHGDDVDDCGVVDFIVLVPADEHEVVRLSRSVNHALVPVELAIELAGEADFSKRSIAAHLLWDRCEDAPDDVPLGVLGRLARPTQEDW